MASVSPQRLRARRAAAFAVSFLVVAWYALPGGSYDTLDRGEHGIALWFAVGAGAAVGLLPRTRLPRGAGIALGVLAVLIAWTALGLRWSESDERTWAEVARLVSYAAVLVLAWVSVGRGTWRAAAAGLVAGAVAVSALAVLSRLIPGLVDERVPVALSRDRLSYPLDYWNAVACWGAMTVAMTLTWSAHARAVWARALLLASTPVCGLAVYLTYARAGVIATALALAASVALSRNRWTCVAHAFAAAGVTGFAVASVRSAPELARATGGEGAGKVALALIAGGAVCAAVAVAFQRLGADDVRLPRPAARIGIAAGVLLAAVLALSVLATPISDAWDEFRTSEITPRNEADPAARLTSAGGTRYRLWTEAVDSWQADARGTGAGTFEFWWNRHEGGEHVLDAHSLYLESLAEIGTFGFLLTVAFLLALLALALRARARIERAHSAGAHAALTAAFVVFLFYAGVDWMWESAAVSVLALAAIALAAAARGAPDVERSRAPRVALVVAALVACLVQAPGAVSERALRDSRDAIEAGDGTRAAERASDAVRAEPWSASAYVQRGLVAEAAGRLDAAAEDLREATEREPTNWRNHLLLARVEARRGRTAQALASFRKAKRLVRRSIFLQPSSSP